MNSHEYKLFDVFIFLFANKKVFSCLLFILLAGKNSVFSFQRKSMGRIGCQLNGMWLKNEISDIYEAFLWCNHNAAIPKLWTEPFCPRPRPLKSGKSPRDDPIFLKIQFTIIQTSVTLAHRSIFTKQKQLKSFFK